MQVIDNREKFEETTSTGNVVIQFSAGWCQPCKVLSRTMTSVTPGHSDVYFYKVDIDSMDKALISHYNVRSVPRLLMFVNGEDVAELIGARGADEISSFINTNKENS